jgi:hypothetical protein
MLREHPDGPSVQSATSSMRWTAAGRAREQGPPEQGGPPPEFGGGDEWWTPPDNGGGGGPDELRPSCQ